MSHDRDNRLHAARIMDCDVVKRVIGTADVLTIPAHTWPHWPHHHHKSIPIDEQGRFSPMATDDF